MISRIKELLLEHVYRWHDCTRCKIGEMCFKHVLFDIEQPNKQIDVLFLGEGPGPQEDLKGRPFVGPAGKFLRAEIELKRNLEPLYKGLNIGYNNLVLCKPQDRPSGPFRQPAIEEILNCSARLEEFIAITKPKTVVLCGNIPQIRFNSEWIDEYKLVAYCIQHPSYLIRTGGIHSPHYPTWSQAIERILKYALQNQKETASG